MKHAGFVRTGACVFAMSVASVLGGPAFAADLPGPYESYKDTPAIVAVPNWAGFYVGGHIGGGWGSGNGQSLSVSGGDGGGGGGGGGDNNAGGTDTLIDGGNAVGSIGGRGGNTTNPTNPNAKRLGGKGGNGGAGADLFGESGDDDTIVGGVHLGYNWQRGNFVFGVEGDASLDGGLDNYLASLRARLGVAQNDAFFYVTGGLAIRDGSGSDAVGLATNGGAGGNGGKNDDGEIDGDGETGHAASKGGLGGTGAAGGSASASGFSSGDGGSETGAVFGAGVEYKLSSNVSAGFEGLYYSFDDEDLTVLRARLTLHLDRSPHESFKDGYLSEAVANWSGFYAGANVGTGFGSGKRVDSVKTANGGNGSNGGHGAYGATKNNGTKPSPDGTDDPGGGGGGGGGGSAALVSLEDDTGILAGVHLGYNWQSGARVFGIEGDANWTDDSFRDYLASIRFRLGHSFDRVLVYGTAGVAFAKSAEGVASVALSSGGAAGNGETGQFENDDAYPQGGGAGGTHGSGGTASVTEGGGGEDQVGFVVGGGFELKLTERTSFGLEGLYYGFDGSDSASSSTSYDAGDDLSSAVVRGRITFHLDGETGSLK